MTVKRMFSETCLRHFHTYQGLANNKLNHVKTR